MKGKRRLIFRLTLLFPFITVVVLGSFFYFSSAYKPNWIYNWDGIRPEIKDTVKSMENYGYVTSRAIGYSGKTPQQWHRRKWFMKYATDAELIKLIDYPNGAVKATAYEGLIKRGNQNNYNLFIKALNDTTTFLTFVLGCEGDYVMLSEYLIEIAFHIRENSPQPIKELYQNSGLTDIEIKQINSIYKERIDKKWSYFEKYYDWR